jgi:hypothetical protein
MLSIAKLSEINGEPRIKLDLTRLHVGDPVRLRFRLKRTLGGRDEVLEADTVFRVTTVGLDHAFVPPRQLLSLEPTGKAPTWQAVKKTRPVARRLSPAVFPRTPV